MPETWTVKRMLEWCSDYLEGKGIESPQSSAQAIVSRSTGLSKIELYMNYERELSSEELDVIRPLVKRRGSGEPLQYLLGTAPFRYLDIVVRPGVLIPRPETEVLVSELLAVLPPAKKRVAADSLLNEYDGAALLEDQRVSAADAQTAQRVGADVIQNPHSSNQAVNTPEEDSLLDDGEQEQEPEEPIVFGGYSPEGDLEAENEQAAIEPEPQISEPHGLLIADICTGTGCIACSLAYERPDVRVIATDISADAVALARENAAACNVSDRIGVLTGDLGSPIESARPQFMGQFDAVISNPPYVPTSVLADLPSEVANFEPALALDGGEDGLDLFRSLLDWSMRALKQGGIFACELHETCLDEATILSEQSGFRNIKTAKDLTGRPRVIVCRKP